MRGIGGAFTLIVVDIETRSELSRHASLVDHAEWKQAKTRGAQGEPGLREVCMVPLAEAQAEVPAHEVEGPEGPAPAASLCA
eukprot:5208761-Alexandrium_andersonii.AAC.1